MPNFIVSRIKEYEMNFYWNKKDNELVVTYYEKGEQAQFIISPNEAIWTGEDSDIRFNEYPQWAFDLKQWIESKL